MPTRWAPTGPARAASGTTHFRSRGSTSEAVAVTAGRGSRSSRATTLRTLRSRPPDGSLSPALACYCLRREEALVHRPRRRRRAVREEEARRGQGRAGPLGRGDRRGQAQLTSPLSRGLGATGSAPALQAG